MLGASAGGLEALREVVAGLPGDLPAAVLVVVHTPAGNDSVLAAILDRCGPLAAAPARHDTSLVSGRIHVAVPDRHLLVRDDRMLLSRAPKQNRARPAVDALFRSAARWHGDRTVAVVLSGTLDDGAAGLAAVDAAGGACLVQNPADAMFPGMPAAALAVVPGARSAPAAALAGHIAALVTEPRRAPATPFTHPDLVAETDMAENIALTPPEESPGRPAAISCPDCTGAMNVVQIGAAVHYTCHVGHVWSPQTLLAAQHEKVEQALWTAVSMLEEQAKIHDELARRAAADIHNSLVESHQAANAREMRTAAGVIRKHFPEIITQP
ncbi:chemotaxis protein CheB [Actinoplanes sp. RD1]|uniref:chemotaxis protein CheB n=1 Tax=Actinoplanes sp. RD1 TaxID=3064538 RepID=UPI002741A26A|nr:chemotaxis protein CheB [Actinoplanes sp. RD1]